MNFLGRSNGDWCRSHPFIGINTRWLDDGGLIDTD